MSRSVERILDGWVIPGLDLLARAYLAAVFICAAIAKIADPYSFGLSIATYEMMPLWSLNVMALVLPWFELVAAVFLLVGFKTRAQVLAINGMLVVFMFAIGSAVSRGLAMKGCGCFASAEAEAQISWAYVLRDAVWFFLGVFVFLAEKNRWGLDTWLKRRTSASSGR